MLAANGLYCEGDAGVVADRQTMTAAAEASARECSLKREKFRGSN